jgi:hypothetical protein
MDIAEPLATVLFAEDVAGIKTAKTDAAALTMVVMLVVIGARTRRTDMATEMTERLPPGQVRT